MAELRELAAAAAPRSASCSRRCWRAAAMSRRSRRSGTIEAQGRIENLEELVEVGARVRRGRRAAGEDTLDVFLQQIALVADADARRDDEGLVTLMTLHNAKGLEYPIVFIAGCEDGVFPHSRALDEGAPGGGAAALLRRRHAGDARAVPDLRAPTGACSARRRYGLRSRFLDEIPADLLDEPERAALGAGVIGAAGRRRGRRRVDAGPRGRRLGCSRAWAAARRASAAPRARSASALGEDVVHAAFGEGVVTGVEPGGVIVVRFAGDGSERKLMAEYAPVSRR